MRKLPFIVLILAMNLVLGCGYSARSALPSNLKFVYVEPFKNSITYTGEIQENSYVPLMESKVRNAINDRFQLDGNLKVGKKESSDLILEGALLNFDRGGLRFTDNEDIEEYRLTITVSLKMRNVAKDKIIWEESSFSGQTTYYLTGPQAKSESAAIDEAVKDLAQRVVARTIEDW